MEIRTSYVHPPIPLRSHDWAAWIDGREERGPWGSGRTEAEAVEELKEQLEEMESEEMEEGKVNISDAS